LTAAEDIRPPAHAQLTKAGFVPLYRQIHQALRERIESGELVEGDAIESEEELARRYQVSRMTARQALRELKLVGYAASQRGRRGTFVTRPKLEKNISHLEGFTQDILRQGMKPSSKILKRAIIKPSQDVAEKLRIAPASKVLHLERLRLADRTPVAFEVSYIPVDRFPGLGKFDFSKVSFYETLKEHYGIRFGWADEIIEATQATSYESQLLTISRHSPVLCIWRVLMSTDEIPLEYARSCYRGDRYQASLRVLVSERDASGMGA